MRPTPPTLNVRQRVVLDNNSSITSLASTAKAKICLEASASALDSGLATVIMSGGQLSWSLSHVGPFHHSELFPFAGPPLLAKSAGLSWLGKMPPSDFSFLSELVDAAADNLLILSSASDPVLSNTTV